MSSQATTRETLANLALLAFFIVILGWLGAALDHSDEDDAAPAYASYHTDPDPTALAVAASRQADEAACRELHGPNAAAVHLPDGQHRCTDKHGRRLPRGVVTIRHEAQP